MRKRYNTPHRSRVVKTRMTEEEYAEFAERLSAYNMSQAEFIRQAITGAAIRSKIFISDCVVFFDTFATFVQTIAGWIALIGKNVAQISNGISNPVIAGIIYWLIRILICGGCLVGAGILVAFIGIKIAGLYKKYCWDMITILVTLISLEIAIYFGDWIKTVLPINMLFFLLLVQLVYVGIRWYVKGWQEARGYY